MRDKVTSIAEAMATVQNGDTVCTSGFVGIGVPDALLTGLEERFLKTGEYGNHHAEASCARRPHRSRPSREEAGRGARGEAFLACQNNAWVTPGRGQQRIAEGHQPLVHLG